jgi:rhamnose transport system permease protein
MRLENQTVNLINIVIGVLLVLSVISTSFLSWASGLATRGRGLGPLRRRSPAADHK